MSFGVEGRRIGYGEPCFVVAEAGVNHDNDPAQARDLVDTAKKAGADAIKWQSYKAEKLAAIDSPLYWSGGETSQREAFAKSDRLSPEDFAEVMSYSGAMGLTAFSTPFDLEAVDALEVLGVPLYKIASGDITYHDLLRKVASTGKPILLSTGGSTMDEIEAAEQVIAQEYGVPVPPLVILACTLCYPTADEDANLRQIEALQELGYPVGLSDHTQSTVLPAVAVGLGACVVEKHYTVSRHIVGSPDHQMSMDPLMMAELVRNIRTTEHGLGHGRKVVLPCEEPARLNARRSVAAVEDILEGGVIRQEQLTALRPGVGIPPYDGGHVVGSKAKRSIPAGSIIREDDLA